LGRAPSNTKLSDSSKIKEVRVRGGNYKLRALRLFSGNYAWGSESKATRTRILDVVYNASNNELTRTETLVKGAIIQVDAAPFKQWFEEHYNLSLAKAKSKDEKLQDKEEAGKLNAKRKEKIEKRRKDHELDPLLRDQFPTGKLLARIASRPGQTGRADGYILEGPELQFYLRKLQQKKAK